MKMEREIQKREKGRKSGLITRYMGEYQNRSGQKQGMSSNLKEQWQNRSL